MIPIFSTNFKFRGYLSGYPTTDPTYDGNVYAASKTMLRLERQDTQAMTAYAVRVTPEGGEYVVYYSDPSGVLELPLKNIVNANVGGGTMTLNVVMYDFGDYDTPVDTSSNDFAVFEGIDEREANIPVKEASDVFGQLPPVVMPPNVILNPAMLRGASAPGIIVESGIQNTGAGYTWSEYAAGVASVITPTGGRGNEIPVDNDSDILELVNGVKKKTWQLDKADRCTDILCVRWRSLTGATRQHCFPVVAYNIGADKSVSLVSPGDGFEVLKNSSNGVTCRIDGLTAYGYWYYADLLRASQVRASLAPATLPWVPTAQDAAFVEAKEAKVTSNGVGFYSFEFTIKLKHYDTV